MPIYPSNVMTRYQAAMPTFGPRTVYSDFPPTAPRTSIGPNVTIGPIVSSQPTSPPVVTVSPIPPQLPTYATDATQTIMPGPGTIMTAPAPGVDTSSIKRTGLIIGGITLALVLGSLGVYAATR